MEREKREEKERKGRREGRKERGRKRGRKLVSASTWSFYTMILEEFSCI